MRQTVPPEACRLSLIYRKVMDAIVPKAALAEHLADGFSPNWQGEDRAHGQVGRAVLEVRVPRGVSVTVSGKTSSGSSVTDVDGNVLMLQCEVAEVARIQGNVRLLHSLCARVDNVGGNLESFFHEYYGNGGWMEGKRPGPTPRAMAVEGVVGDVEMDIGCVDLTVREPGGNVRIRKRAGRTLLQATQWCGRSWRIEQTKDDVTVELPDELLRELAVMVATLTGGMDFSRTYELTGNSWISNNSKMAFYCSKPKPDLGVRRPTDADVVVLSEAGDVTVKQLEL